jgi:hypothetical protein
MLIFASQSTSQNTRKIIEKMASDLDSSSDIWFRSDLVLNVSHNLNYIGDDYSKDLDEEDTIYVF